MVLGPWGEGEHRGEVGSRALGGEGSCRPGEDGGRAPLTGPGHRAGQVPGVATLQSLWDEDVRCVGQGCEEMGRQGDQKEGPRGGPERSLRVWSSSCF